MKKMIHHLLIGPILVNPEAPGAGQTADEIIRTGLKKGIIALEVATYILTHTREDGCCVQLLAWNLMRISLMRPIQSPDSQSTKPSGSD